VKHYVSEEKPANPACFEDSEQYSDRENTALAYAEAPTYTSRDATRQHFNRMRKHFDDDAIIELTTLIVFQNLSRKFNASLTVAPKGFCNIAPRSIAKKIMPGKTMADIK